MTEADISAARDRAANLLRQARITLSAEEYESISVLDFCLNRFDNEGAAVLVYVDNEACHVSELALLPLQTWPEHAHHNGESAPSNIVTMRCRFGGVRLYVQGVPTEDMLAELPEGSTRYYTARHEIELGPGGQYTIEPGVLHWMQAGPEGAVLSRFSGPGRFDEDVYTDPRIQRLGAQPASISTPQVPPAE